MKIKDLEGQANSILRLFGPKEIDLLYHEMVDFLYIWDSCDHTDKLMQDELTTDLDHLRLLRTAIAMSRIADMYSRTFDKISRKFPNFWKKCEQVAEDLRIEVNNDDHTNKDVQGLFREQDEK